MKKKLFLIPALALLLASCSNDQPFDNELQKPEYAVANSYLNINLRQSVGNPMGTRADNSYNQNNGTYEDGTGAESKITHVRFYFFNETGQPFSVRQDVVNDLYDNFVDWYPNSTEFGDPNHPETVEQTLNATVGITLTDEDEKPAKVLAVANPTSEILAFESQTPIQGMSPNSMSLTELRGIVTDYLPADEDTPFVMSNSVYVDDDEAVYATELQDNNFQSTPDEAALPANVVKIYIERVLARLDFGIGMDPVELKDVQGTFYSLGAYDLNDGADGSNAKEEEQIYVKFLGWNVTSTTSDSRLIKDVNANWGVDDILGDDTPWYITQLHRSFWALNPKDNEFEFQFGNFGSVTGEGLPTVEPTGQFANSLGIPAKGSFTKTYLQENANPYTQGETPLAALAPVSPTKVIIAAQLVDNTGTPLTVCRYQNVNYTLDGLKNQLAKQLRTLYYQTNVGGKPGWAQISADMIDFTTVDPAGTLPGDKEYFVYAVLSQEAEDNVWASSNDGVNFTPLTDVDNPDESDTAVVNTYIRSKLTSIMIWNSGLTYYFFDVKHLGLTDEEVGFLGIVRNHIYRTTVTSVAGLGTPVYNPGLVIHPEKTENDETIIQFTIEPLSWRLVSSSYELDWE